MLLGLQGLKRSSTLLPRAAEVVSRVVTTSAPAEAAKVNVAASKSALMREFQVYRWDPDNGTDKPTYKSYNIDVNRSGLLEPPLQPGGLLSGTWSNVCILASWADVPV